jgi:hypothetical protein
VAAAVCGATRRARRYRVGVLAAGLGAMLAAPAPARAQEVGYTASLFVARSTYPTDRFTSIYLFNSVDLTAGPVRASFSLPFVRQRVTTFDAAVDPLTGVLTDLETTTTGLGDPLVRADLRVVDDRSRGLQVAIAGSVKLPLVDADDGLGTGVADYGIGGSLFKAAGRTSLYADVLFWKYGDPEGIDFDDSLSYSVGMGRVIGGGRWSAMVSLAGFSQGIGDTAPPVQLNVAVLALAGRRQSVAVTAGIGLNEGSGFSIGTSWRIGS